MTITRLAPADAVSRGSISRPMLWALPKALEEAAGHQLHHASLGRIRAPRKPDLHLRRRRGREQLRHVLQLPLRFLESSATSSA